MGVLIKSMEMPKKCSECKFWAITSCTATFQGEKSCPLIEVPEPHGRLIDADALEYEEAYLNGHYELGDVEIVTRKDIESAPTIIQSSEEGET